jgi:hypothetical protein
MFGEGPGFRGCCWRPTEAALQRGRAIFDPLGIVRVPRVVSERVVTVDDLPVPYTTVVSFSAADCVTEKLSEIVSSLPREMLMPVAE